MLTRNGLFTTKNKGLNFQPSMIAKEIYGEKFTDFFHVAGKVTTGYKSSIDHLPSFLEG